MNLIIFLLIFLNFSLLSSSVNVLEKKDGKYLHWQGEAYGVHNRMRHRHCVNKLILDPILSYTAQATSKKLCAKNKLEHSNNDYGENLYMIKTEKNTVIDKRVIVKQAIKTWYSEKNIYNYENPNEKNPNILHFTQIVWKNMNKLGCGVTECIVDNKKNVVVVCNYKPRGNILGQFKQNVLQSTCI